MRLLILIWTAGDVISYNYIKWLKHSMDVTIDVFECSHSKESKYYNEYYNELETAATNRFFEKIGFLRGLNYLPMRRSLEKFLRGKHYDAIHCHGIIPEFITARGLKKHCNKLYATFWGGEYSTIKIFHSHSAYLKALDRFIDQIDYMVNSEVENQKMLKVFPQLKGKQLIGYFGSSPLDALFSIMEHESKRESKIKMDIEPDKFTVLIGYSGKKIHRHIPIINEIIKSGIDKNRIHLLAPMTRGASDDYVESVESCLEASGFSYTLQKGRFLSDEDIARLRNATDITLQFSDYDAFSRSILEVLCARSVMIYGSWLDYDSDLERVGMMAVKASSIAEGISKMKTVISDFAAYDEMTYKNFMSGNNKELWPECIKKWVEAYLLSI